jgi:hypothetical protein
MSDPSTAVATARNPSRRISSWLLGACGVWLIGLGLYFIFVRPALLPEDPRYIGASLEHLREAAPGLESWLRIVFTVMGGFMAGAGVLTVLVSSTAVRDRAPATGWAIAVAGATTVGLMSAMNFVLHSDFRWVLMLPVLLWLAALLAYARDVSAAR